MNAAEHLPSMGPETEIITANLGAAINRLSEVWFATAKTGLTGMADLPDFFGGGIETAFLIAQAPGKLGRHFGQCLFATYDQPNTLYLLAGGFSFLKHFKYRESYYGAFELNTGEFGMEMIETSALEFYALEGDKSRSEPRTTKFIYKGNQADGVTEALRVSLIPALDPFPIDNLPESTKMVTAKIDRFLDFWTKDELG